MRISDWSSDVCSSDLAVIWSLVRGAARSGMELLWVATAATVMIPLASLAAMVGVGWSHAGTDRLIDGVAIIGAVAFAAMARATRRRAFGGPRDRVWSAIRPAPARTAAPRRGERVASTGTTWLSAEQKKKK